MKSIKFTLLTLTLTALTASMAFAQYDDVYYDPSTDPGVGQSGDYEEDYYNETAPKEDYRDGYIGEGDRNQNPSYSETQYDEEGNTYITNNYYEDYYDYSYSSRLRRFYDPYAGFGYYSDVYTNAYYYTYDPYFYGTNIYVSSSRRWRPRRPGVYISIGWGYPVPYYSFYQPYGYYPNYWSYNPYSYWNGYNNGYWAGYNDGYWANNYYNYYCPPSYYSSPGYANGSSGNVYYGPRNGGRTASNNSPDYNSQGYINKTDKMSGDGNPVKTNGNTYDQNGSAPVKGVNTTAPIINKPKENSTYTDTKEPGNTTVKSPTGQHPIKTNPDSKYNTDPKPTIKNTTNNPPAYSNPKGTYNTNPKSYEKPSTPINSNPPAYSNPKGTYNNTQPKSYEKPSAPVNSSPPAYTKPAPSNSNYSKPKSKSNYTPPKKNSKPKSYSAPKQNKNSMNASSSPGSNAKSQKAAKSSWGSSSKQASPKTYKAPKSNYSSGKSVKSSSYKPGSSSKTYNKPSSTKKFGKK